MVKTVMGNKGKGDCQNENVVSHLGGSRADTA